MTAEPDNPSPSLHRLFSPPEPRLAARWERAWLLLSGPPERFDLRGRVLNVFTLLGALAAAAALVANVAVHDDLRMQLFSGLAMVGFVLVLAGSRTGRLGYAPVAASAIVLSCVVTAGYWVGFGGSSGAGPAFLFSLTWFPFLGRRAWTQLVSLGGVVALALALFAVDIAFPAVVAYSYDSPLMRITDVASSTVASVTMCGAIILALGRSQSEALQRVRLEHDRAEALLRMMMPAETIADLKSNPRLPIAYRHADATVLFADISGFTALAATADPEALVGFLHRLFDRFDAICEEERLEKIKTIGDAYIAVAGVPCARADHARRAARAALRMRAAAEQAFAEPNPLLRDHRLGIRIGLHSGPLLSGVLSRSKVAFDLWGDTVNIASRMESQGVVGQV